MSSHGQEASNFSMLELFGIEVETQAAILKEKLPGLASNPDVNKELDLLMRAVHSIKGAAGIVQLDAAARLARVMEDALASAGSGTITLAAPQNNVLLQAVDMLLHIAAIVKSENKNWPRERDTEIESLVAAISAMQTPAAVSVPPPPASSPPPVAISPPAHDDFGDNSMLELFHIEVETQAVILSEKLLALESNPSASKELEALMRASHSIKGAARVVQLDAAVKVAHVMEDVFVAAQAGKITLQPDHIDVLLQGVDFLQNICQVSPNQLGSWLRERHGEIESIAAAIGTILVPGAALTPVQPVSAAASLPAPSERSAPVVAKKLLPALEEKPAQELATSLENENAARVVRVSADNLNRIMGLAGESLVAANGLQPFAESLLLLRKKQLEVSNSLEKLQDQLKVEHLNQYRETFDTARRKAYECREILTERLTELELYARRVANLSDRLYREVIASNMRPFADGVHGFPRMVRDLSRNFGKKVNFEIIGKNTPVDRDILDKLEAPLTHILRNAIDHGIELPSERLQKGKPAEGTLQLQAVHRAGMLAITVADDGRGVDPEKLRQKIVSKQLVALEMAEQLTESELIEFLFLPGFSTASKVTEISGRGVGLDVVQSMIQEVGGMLRATSTPGEGMTFHLQLPLTLSVIRTLLVEIGGEPYAFPLTRIDRIVMVPFDEISVAENRQYFTMDEQNIALVAADIVLELEAPPLDLEILPTVVVSDRLCRYGLVVERCLGERDFVIRPLDPRLGKVADISAAALMEDGSPVLILDVDDMVRSIDKLLANDKLKRLALLNTTPTEAVAAKQKRILVVDDSITVRETERKLLESNGYVVDMAVNGMDGWNAVRAGNYDLVVSDIDMPRMNGFELVTLIRNNPNLKTLPVIIVSYKDNEENRIRGMEVGANYYLTKNNIHDNTLLQAVQELIG